MRMNPKEGVSRKDLIQAEDKKQFWTFHTELNRLALKEWEENWAELIFTKASVIVAQDFLVSYRLIFLQNFTKLNNTNINDSLRNLETDLTLPRSKTNFLRRSFKYIN